METESRFNDPGDLDSGVNNLQNFPVLTAAAGNGVDRVTVDGSLNSTADTQFRIEFFASTTADPTGYGEGERYLGFATVTTDGSGNATFSETLVAPVADGEFVTATATDASGNTSEFGLNVSATTSNNPTTLDLDANNSSGASGADFFANFIEDGGAAAVADSDASLSDLDSPNLYSLTVTITNLWDGVAELLSADTNGTSITANYTSGTGVLLLSGGDTLAHYEQVLRTVSYNNTSDNPNTTARSITFVANDGANDSNLGTTIVTMVAQNDAPVLAGANDLTSISEDPLTNTGTSIAALISGYFTDPDVGALQGIAVTAVDNTDGTWEYSTDSGGTWTAFGAPTSTSARLLAENASTRVRFVPNADWNGTVSSGITFHAWDQTTGTHGGTADLVSVGTGGATAFSAAAFSSDITVNAVNDAPYFGTDGDGSAVTPIPGSLFSLGFDSAVQSDGKIIVVGSSYFANNDFSIVRYNANGTLDVSFGGGDGIATLDVGGNELARDVAVQSDGKIVVLGSTDIGADDDLVVARFNSDGTLDTSFDSDGYAITNVNGIDSAASLAIQSDGKIVVVGTNEAGGNNFSVVRYTTAGALDSSFDTDGMATIDFGGSSDDTAAAVSIQSDGKIVVGGTSNNQFALTRLTTSGALDTSFDTDGLLTTDFGVGDEQISGMVLQSDGRIIAVGTANLDFALARYNTNGSLDTSFDTDGLQTSDMGATERGYDVTLTATEQIVIAGITDSLGSNDVMVQRYHSNGSLDTGFNAVGTAITVVGGTNEFGYSVHVLSDGSVVVGGNVQSTGFLVNKYNEDGTPDTDFAPTTNLLDGNPTFLEGGAPVVLDADVQVFDIELIAADDYSGSGLTINRMGGAVADDAFSATGNLVFSGANLVLSGITIGTVDSNTGGTLALTFNGNATQARVNEALQSIAYANTSDAPPASVQLLWSFDDGNTGAQGAGGPLSATGSVTVSITAVNDAPVLDNTKNPALIDQNQDSGAPVGAVGTLVSSLVDFASPAGQVDNVTDPDSGALLGIAVIAADTANGTWFYSTNNGTNWNALGAVGNSNARLLAADANTRLYFQPNANYTGMLASAVTFRAWDQTSGSNGALANTTTNGGTTAFSTATDTASLVVNAVISGTVYSDEGITNIGANKTVRIAINGTDFGTTAETDANGAYSISGLTLSVGDVLTVYLEDEIQDAVVVTVSDGSGPTSLDLYQDRLIVRHDHAGSLTNANLATAFVVAEDDISNIYSISGGNLTVEIGNELLVWTGHTFAPGADIDVFDLDIDGALSMGDHTATVGGDWDATGGSFSFGSAGTAIIQSLKSINVVANGSSFNDLVVAAGFSQKFDFNTAASPTAAGYTGVRTGDLYSGPAGYGWQSSPASDDRGAPSDLFRDFAYHSVGNLRTFSLDTPIASSDYTVTVYLGDNSLFIDQVKVYNADNPGQGVYGISTAGAGIFTTVSFVATSGADGILDITFGDDGGASSYWKVNGIEVLAGDVTTSDALSVVGNLSIDQDATVVLGGTVDVDGDVTMALGANLDVSAADYALTVGGSWTDNGANFNARAGTVTLDGSAAGNTVTASADFFNLDINGAGGEWTLQGDLTATGSLTVSAGTLTQTGSAITINAPVTINGGTFTGVNQDLTILGDLAIDSGTFTAPSSSLIMIGSMIQSGGLFAHNGGTVVFPVGSHNLAVTDAFYNLSLGGSFGKFDFNSGVSPTAAGYTGVLPTDLYSGAAGYGWRSSPASDDRGAPTDLFRDFAYGTVGNARIFSAGINYASQDFLVTVYAGDNAGLRDNMQAYNADIPAQGVFDIDTPAGSFATETFMATAGSDGILDIAFNDTGGVSSYWMFNGIEIVGAATITLNGALDIENDLTINAGANLSASNNNIDLGGDWNNEAGTSGFTAGTTMVTLAGSGTQTVRGSTTFHELAATTTTARTVQFQSGQTQTIAAGGSLTLTGTSGQLLTLAAETGAADWLLDVNATAAQSVSYVSVSYSDASAGAVIDAADGTNVDGGNNTNWAFNNAPVLDNTKNPALIDQNEDSGAPVGAVGTLVSSLVDFASPAGQVDNVTDLDSGALLGIAVTAADTTNGTWWYSTNAGINWNALGAVAIDNARLLAADANTRLYFQPNANYNGTLASAITFRAWDQTSGSSGGLADTSINGGSTAFSTATDTASLVVNPVNDAPLLDSTGTMALTTITEDQTANTGNTVASIIASAGGDRIADVDSGAVEGIAITALNSGNGAWEYSTNGGGSWNSIGVVTDSSALLLRDTDLVRFVPDGQNGTAADFTFRAWDQTSGAFGTKVDVSTNGGTTAFSTATETAGIVVTPVNDEQLLATSSGLTVAENSLGNVIDNTRLLTTDVDNTTAQLVYTVTTATSNGTLRRNGTALAVNDTFTQADIDADLLTYDHNGSETSSDSFSFSVDDGAGTPSPGTFNITITPVNDNNPVITSDGGGATASVNVNENDTAVTTVTATDADLPAQTLTYAITGGADAAFFAIDSNTGALTFLAAPDYEAPADADSDNVYEVTVQVSDGALTDTQAISVTVQPVNDNNPVITSDGGGATASVNVNENDTAVTTVTATDADLPVQTLSYAIAGGADAGFFAIDSNTGALTFLAPPDYEAPADANSDNVYEVTVQVSDGTLTDTQAISVTVQPVNDNNPIITSDGGGATASVNVNENDTAVTTVTATDADLPAQTLTYAIAGGADAAFFTIDGNTGALTFLAPPDYEAPADANSDNVYEVTVQASDGTLIDTQAISVSVQPLNDNNPVITSDGGGATASVNVNENDTAVTTVTATDADLPAQTLTYSIAGGADAAFFAIDGNTGALTFLAPPDYEAPADANGDNVYELTVEVSDGAHTDTQAISVTVQPVNDNNPVITSDGGGATASVNVNENNTAVTTVTATDADLPAQTLTYAIAGGADAAFFTIDGNTGALTFLAPPDYEAPADANSDNVYEVTVQASDGTLIDTQAISVSVQPVNDNNPVITSDGGGATASVNVNENDTAVTTVTATDADLPAQTLTYAIAGGADAAFFTIDGNTGALTFLAPPDYEAPADADSDNVYEVTVQASDGALTDTQAISVSVQPLNDNNPVITSDGGGASASVNVNENTTAVTTVTATDADLPAQTLTYAIAGGADAAFFAIDSNTGALTFLAAPDYEAPADANGDNVYEVTVEVSDGALTDTQAISVTVQPVNDNNPVITSDGGGATASVNVNENDTAVTTVTATDADLPAQTLTYSIAGGADAAFFAIDSNTGALTFLAPPDYEAPADANSDNVYEVTVQVSDGALTDTQAISVSVQPVNDNNPVITSDGGGATASVNVNENDTAVTTVTATDADLPAQTLTYSIAGGADATFFTIDGNTGALTFLAAPDYEAPADANSDNVYEVTVQVSDGALTDTQAISVSVQPVNDNNPVITSDGGGATASVNVNENDTAVTTVTATDADLPAQTLTYSIAGGADAAFFAIDVNTGALTFLAAPDYETPADANGDNVYEVTVEVSDGALTDTQAISVSVQPVNDNNPVITSDGGGATASVNVNENDTTVTTVTATDADLPAQTLTYAIAGGTDAAFFTIDGNTGALTFLAAPDYEAPADADSDNVYEVTVQVSDGALTDTQAISVSVQPVNDNNPVITSDGGGATASVNVNENDTAVTTVTATDADLPAQTLTYAIAGGADAALFSIDGNTGALTFLAPPDYEAPADANGDNVYEVTVQVSDGALTDTQAISVSVQPLNEHNPVITSDGGGATASVNVNENDTAVTTVTASDADLPAQTLTYSIAGGADAAFFTIDVNTGALTFLAPPDYEAPADANSDNVYEVTVQVSDGALTDTQAISVSVQPVNDNNPVITSDGGGATASVNVNENDTAVTTVAATDADLPVQTLTYSIAGGADAAFFAIDGNSGALTFLAPPDYEAPADADSDNVYEVTVQVSDGALTDTQAISVTVQPVNDNNPIITSDGGGATATVNVNENNTAVTTVTATDADLPAQTLTYAIAGGVDAAFFAIDSNTGALTFLAPPDYEAAADANSDNVYEVTVQVSDGALTDTQAISVTVQPVNDNNPVITSDGGGATASVNVNENTTVVTTVTATDADLPAQTLTYAIAGGADAAFFAIDSNTGALTFLAPPDYEAPADADSDNVYEVTVEVSDGALTDTQAISVSVQPLNEHNPVITSDGGGATANVNVNENTTAVTTVTATDADLPAQTLTYAIAGGADAALFSIDGNTGALTFLAPPDYEAPADANGDNVYEVTVQASDGTLTDTQAISVTVQPVNDNNPVITSDGGGATASVNVNENTTVVTTVTATDADLPAQTLTYAIAGGADAAFFAIDVNTGALTFLAAPDYEAPADANGDNVYEVTVQASDGTLTDTQAISVSVQPVNDNNPVITSDGGGATASVNVNENDTAVTTVTATDADLPAQTLTYAIAGGADATFFTIDSNTGSLTFLAPPDFESPADANGDNVYEVTVQVTDGALTDTQAISVTVQPVNDNNPVITSDGGGATASVNVNENTTVVTTVTATDADLPAQTLTYAIAGGADAAFFAIDSNTGALTFLAAPDYEAPADADGDNVYEVTVEVSDGALTDTQAISVTVQPLNEHNPVITSDGGGATASVNVNENTTAVTTVTATDADLPAQTLSYAIAGGADAAFFAIDVNSGALTFLAAPDYEAAADANSDNVYEVTVQVSDGALTDTQAISVTVQPVNDNNPIITSDGGGATASVNVNENNTAVTTVTATDADLPAQTLTYAIAGGADAAFFTIDGNSGVLTFLAAPDYEAPADANSDNVYEVTVQASDGTLTDTQAISVSVQPVNDNNPVITSDGGGATASVNVNENNTAVTTVTATDADLPAQTLTYSIAGGADAAFFAIDGNTGALTFLAAPDYEAPADANGDNVYEVTVQVSDGALTDTQAISVTVQPVNDNNPVITSDGGGATASVNVNENDTAVTTVTATDADLPAQTLTYAIAGGADAAFFAIDVNSGALTFLAAPDYEAPADANSDNVYEVTVQVSDGALTDTQAISVTVQPVNDNNPVITSDGGGATASVNVNENDTAVTTVTATDADLPAQTLTYSIAGGADAAFFAIDVNTGALTFLAPPDYEAPADANGDNVYEVTVQVSDGALTDTQAISVSVQPLNDNNPVITSDGGGATASVNVNENATAVTTVTATDADLPAQTLVYSIMGGADAAFFAIDGNTGALTFLAAPDYEAPADANSDNVYEVTVQVSDGALTDTQAISVSVQPVNDNNPVITSDGGGATAIVNVNENDTAVTTVTATDADLPAQTLTYAIAGGADAAFFAIDSNTGALTFLARPDYEAPADANGDNVYEVTVQVSDGDLTDTQAISVTVQPVNDNNPVITSDGGGAPPVSMSTRMTRPSPRYRHRRRPAGPDVDLCDCRCLLRRGLLRDRRHNSVPYVPGPARLRSTRRCQ